jgi:DAACS family dicarboxylate/amino acid:cation (Na+ or H+) symporter
MRLQTKILIGLVAGLAAGFLARLPQLPWLRSVIEWTEPVGTIFIRLITMIVIPLVAGSLFTSVASLGSMRRLGNIGARTLAWFLGSTFLAAIIGLVVALMAGIGGGLDQSVREAVTQRFAEAGAGASANIAAVPSLKQTLINIVPVNPIAAAAQGDLLALIFTIILFAAAATALDEEKRRPLVSFFRRRERCVDGRNQVVDDARAGGRRYPDRGDRGSDRDSTCCVAWRRTRSSWWPRLSRTSC